jgi:hypothetical protein
VFRQPALGLDGGLAAHAGGGHSLPVNMVGAVARDINAGHLDSDLRTVYRPKITVLIDIERGGKWRGVRYVANGDEDAFHRQYRSGAGLGVEPVRTLLPALC